MQVASSRNVHAPQQKKGQVLSVERMHSALFENRRSYSRTGDQSFLLNNPPSTDPITPPAMAPPMELPESPMMDEVVVLSPRAR